MSALSIAQRVPGRSQKGRPLSSATRCLLLSLLDTLFQRALRMGATSVNPVRQLDKRDRPKHGSGGRRALNDIQRAFRKARERAALPVTEDGVVVFHSLRHTGISRAANHPAIPLVHVRDFARHANLATTQGYAHKIEDAKVTAALGEALVG